MKKRCLTSAWAHKWTRQNGQKEETVTKKACLLLLLLQWQRELTIIYSSKDIYSMCEEFEWILTLGQHCWVYRANKKKQQLHQKNLKHLEIMKVERRPPASLHCSEATDPEPTSWSCGCPDCPQLVSYSPSKTDCVCVCVIHHAAFSSSHQWIGFIMSGRGLISMLELSCAQLQVRTRQHCQAASSRLQQTGLLFTRRSHFHTKLKPAVQSSRTPDYSAGATGLFKMTLPLMTDRCRASCVAKLFHMCCMCTSDWQDTSN